MREYSSYANALAEVVEPGARAELLSEIAERGKQDHHFFCAVIMGTNCMSPSDSIHGRACMFLMDERYPRKWLEAHRGFMKSTVATEGTSLREVAADPSEHVLIVSAVEPLAASFLSNIKACVESPVWKMVYPELRPDPRCWRTDRAGLQRPGRHRGAREPNWTIGSLQKGITGGHYTRLKWDDLVIPEFLDSRERAQWVIDKFKALKPLRDNWQTPELMSSTPYKSWDLYGWLKRTRPDRYRRLVIPLLTEVGGGVPAPRTAQELLQDARRGALVPAWPEEFPVAALDDLMEDPEVFWPQYMLSTHVPDRQYFRRHQFRYFRRPKEPLARDWSQNDETVQPIEKPLGEMTLYMGWDPAAGVEGGDDAAFSVVGTDTFGNFYWIEAAYGNYSLMEQIDLFFTLQRTYNVWRTSAEMAGPFAAMNATLRSEMDARRNWPWVEKAELRNRRKEERVQLILGRIYQGRKMFHHHLLHGTYAEQQLLDFPGGRKDDIPDSLAHAVEIAQKYGGFGSVSEEKSQEHAALGFRQWERIAYTHEELQSRVPPGMLALAEGRKSRRVGNAF